MLLLSGCGIGNDPFEHWEIGEGWGLCPVLKDYTPEVLEQAAAELEAMEPNAVLVTLVDDYSLLRDQVRLCNFPN